MDFVVGSLVIIFGPMLSGKTTKALTILSEYIIPHSKNSKLSSDNICALVINHSIDTRTNKWLSTHNPFLKIVDNHAHYIKTDNLSNIDIKPYSFILVDESQFFDTELYVVLDWVEKYHKHVIVSGLSGDYQRNKYGCILDLIPKADRCEQLYAHCTMCIEESSHYGRIGLTNAPFTHRRNQELNNQTVIGDSDKYEALCRYHYQLKNNFK